MNRNAPYWGQLPTHAKNDLKRCRPEWFDAQSDIGRLTVLNIYVKLSGMNLWHHLQQPATQMVRDGCFDFHPNNIVLLRRDLTNRWDFRSPEEDVDRKLGIEATAAGSTIVRMPMKRTSWDSAEKRATAALHFKQHEGWAEKNIVEVHIDQAGNWLGNRALWWAGQPVTGIRHLASYDSYKDVFGIRDLLLQQGWDSQSLLGLSIWHCGARDCSTHSRPEHRCSTGFWYCGRRQPLCPGHSSPNHQCPIGSVWHCGARDCPTHSQPGHLCQHKPWYCGRIQPPCPGHSNRDHRCESGAALLHHDRKKA